MKINIGDQRKIKDCDHTYTTPQHYLEQAYEDGLIDFKTALMVSYLETPQNNATVKIIMQLPHNLVYDISDDRDKYLVSIGSGSHTKYYLVNEDAFN